MTDMKKIFLILASFLLSTGLFAQVTNQDVEVRKIAPRIWGNGSGGQLKLYNTTITESSGNLLLGGGNFNLQTNNLLGTGTIGLTGSRFLKGYFIDFDLTNLPTIGGVALKTSLNLNNVTNESKATMFTNSVFTGTHTIPTPFTLGATSVTTTGAQLNYLNTAIGKTGTDNLVFSTSPIFGTQITVGSGVITAAEAGYIDPTSSIQTQFGTKLAIADSSETDDSSPLKYPTPKRVKDIENDLANTIDITSLLSGGGSNTSRLQFIVDTTANAPAAGDSILTQSTLIEKHIEVYRGNYAGGMANQWRNLTGHPQWIDGYRFQKSTGTVIFKPVFATAEKVAIFVSDSTTWTNLTLDEPFTAGYCDEYMVAYNAMTNKPPEAQADIQNAFIQGMVTGGYFDRSKMIYFGAQYSNAAGEALINMASPGTYDLMVVEGSPVHTEDRGLASTGDDVYTTGWVPAVDSTQLIAPIGLNNITLMAYITTEQTGAYSIMGTHGSNGSIIYLRPRSVDNISSTLNGTGVMLNAGMTTSLGFTSVTRRGAHETEGYKNGVPISSDTDASIALPTTRTLSIFAINESVYNEYYTGSFAIIIVMNATSDADNEAIYDLVHTAAVGLGFDVE